eukprot:jgi/Chrzof1/8054/UNPLg00099.t1
MTKLCAMLFFVCVSTQCKQFHRPPTHDLRLVHMPNTLPKIVVLPYQMTLALGTFSHLCLAFYFFPVLPHIFQVEKECEAITLDLLHNKCAIADVFADSRFLKPEALQALVGAIIAAPGIIPRPPGSSSYADHVRVTGSMSAVDWEAAELCLGLLLVVLLRNRDRIQLLWPPVMEHLTAIIRGRGVDGAVVQTAASGVLRLCQRLLPYKADAADHLLRGLQLVPSIDPDVAWMNAAIIAGEILSLVKVASPHIRQQWAWASVCNLIKMTSVRPEAFPISLQALDWVVHEAMTPLNYVLAMEATVWFVERAALEHPDHKEQVLDLLGILVFWLEGWSDSLKIAGLSAEQMEPLVVAKSEFWLYTMEMLCKLAEHPDLEVRNTATHTLQRVAINGERIGVVPASLERGLRERVLPPIETLSKKVKSRDMPQVDLTVRELVRVVTKMILLYLPQLQLSPGFSKLWTAVLHALTAAHASGSEVLAEAVPEALKNALLMMHDMAVLQPGWTDANGADLWELTWRSARKISSNITPQMLSPPVNAPATASQRQQQQQAAVAAPMPGVMQEMPQAAVVPGAVAQPQAALAEAAPQSQAAAAAGNVVDPVVAVAADALTSASPAAAQAPPAAVTNAPSKS